MIDVVPLRRLSGWMAVKMAGCHSNYERCRPDREFGDWMYMTVLLSLAAFIAVIGIACISVLISPFRLGALTVTLTLAAGVAAAALACYGRAYSVKSTRDYRGALIDASLVHAVGFMLTMAESNVPLKRMFENISNLGSVYGKDISLEAAYILSLADEDGMDIVSALRKAQATSPSAAWQELLIGIAEAYGSGGSLNDYLKSKYQAFTERKLVDVKRYNESIQGMASIYLSVVGIASIFVSLINLVFNMAGWLGNDSLVWLDALVAVPLGSFIVIRMMRSINPEA
jgi:archaellum biogenesis protein FlaJ (TadC family)